MPINVRWNGGEPPDVEEWEDLLQAEYGTALGQVDLEFERAGEGYRLVRAVESVATIKTGPRLDARQRFVRALRLGGKRVLGESEDLEDTDELETVSIGALNERAEKARRQGGSGE
jgi:hypothetical protein